MNTRNTQREKGVQVVWFKRDLRIADHRPLFEAAGQGPCLCLYVYEPDVITAPDFDAAHLEFINQSLGSLDRALRSLGAHLTVRVGRMPDVLDKLHAEARIAALWSHEETGNAITYARDKRVAAWAARNKVPWTEHPGHGVVRRLATRDGWASRWTAHVNAPIVPAPEAIQPVAGVPAGRLQDPTLLGIDSSKRVHVQSGGIDCALQTLESFLELRGVNYRKDMSSPGPAWNGCSRLSTYLAWGNLSIRQVYQRTRSRRLEVTQARRAGTDMDPRWGGSLGAFEQRLRWHCHFIQKLEDEPDIEFQNMSRAYDGLREDAFDNARFDAWCAGQTGYPMVDACIRALHQSGWINFRMRAMLMSFASYHLWLHWRPTALHLARLFLDYEPGIHYSQSQMQSGVTGINAIRIYSPIKQVADHDPHGEFIRQYCPELARVPDAYIAEPHKMPGPVQRASGCVIGTHYPFPIVENGNAYRQARARIYAVKGTSAARKTAAKVYAKHGSRRRPRQRQGQRV
jgi:deoxyribodipyrimidine photo-lyase